MAYIAIPSADVDAGSIIDESLMSGKIKNNFDDHETRILALEAGGSGGGGSTDIEEKFATITSGGFDDVGVIWRRRFHPHFTTLGLGATGVKGFDGVQKDHDERFFVNPKFEQGSSWYTDSNTYMGFYYRIPKGEILEFRIKKGENFFGVMAPGSSITTDGLEVYIDGVRADTYGLVNENGDTVAGSNNTNFSTIAYGLTFWHYGLDGEEHVVRLVNNDSASKVLHIDGVVVGYKTIDPTINHTVAISSGRANVNGTDVNFNEANLSFSEPGEGLMNGYTGMVKIDNTGALTAVDGLSPAFTQVKANETIAFSSTVTSLPVKNHFAFPSANGICVMQHPSGQNYVFSYTSKTNPDPANQTFAGLVWQRQPQEDFTPLPTHSSALNEWRGDLRISLWAKAPIVIDNTNNKVDFEITVNGTTTAHTATLANGAYAADIMPIEQAFVEAMNSAKAITGEYFLKYDNVSQRWTIGVNGGQNQRIDFLFATGANSSASFGPTIGFSTDLTVLRSYTATTDVQHLAQQLYLPDKEIWSHDHPQIQYNWSTVQEATYESYDNLAQRLGLSGYRLADATSATGKMLKVYPDDDCCGLTVYTADGPLGAYFSYWVDGSDCRTAIQTDRPQDSQNQTEAGLKTFFIEFPKGTRSVTLRLETNTIFEIEDTAQDIIIFGFRQWFTKPPWETLTNNERILKTYEISPLSIYCTNYGNTGGLYSPAGSNDNIDTITESGTWANVLFNRSFNGQFRRATVAGTYVDVEFTLQGDGGGIGLKTVSGLGVTENVEFYLGSGSIVEATDLVDRKSEDWVTTWHNSDCFRHLGLSAGTYIARFKNVDGVAFNIAAFQIYDTVQPEENAYTFGDLTNSGQGLAVPINVRRNSVHRYGSQYTPNYLSETRYQIGKTTGVDYKTNAHSFLIYSDSVQIRENLMGWYGYQIISDTGDFIRWQGFAKSISMVSGNFSTRGSALVPFVDGVQTPTNVDQTEDVKGGSTASATNATYPTNFNKLFELDIAHSASLTFTMSDTRGLRDGQRVILVDSVGAEEVAYVENIVTNTSFDIKQALSTIAEANVVRLKFYGFHNVRFQGNDAADYLISRIEWEPLPLQRSFIFHRATRRLVLETKVSVWQEVANNGDITYPVHSDGVQGSWLTSSIELIGSSAGAAFNFGRQLKDISVGSGTIDVKITSRRLVAEDGEDKGDY